MENIIKEPILYVDDESENLQGFNYLLRRDFHIYLASSAKEGLEILRNNEIKVVLTDQRMPEVSGVEFLEQVLLEFPDIIRIIVTAYSDTETVLQAINQGKVYQFITKPWNNSELKIIINRALETFNLRKDKIQLINFLQQANHELIEAKEKAEESDRLKSSFLANMSHEIRTPLNAIVGFSNLIASESTPMETKCQFVRIIENSSNDLLNIIEDILDTSRIESGFVSINQKTIDIHKVMGELLLVFQNSDQLNEKPIKIRYKYPKAIDQLLAYIDELRVKQVLSNLVYNAIKFTEKGEIEIGYEIINKDSLHFLRFFVKDTGIGIPDDKFEYIFERFRKIESDHDVLYRGNGLGLFISRKLAHMMGGHLTVESQLGVGSTFFLTLPYIQTPVDEDIQPRQSSNQLTKSWPNKTILVVEDESSNYKYLEALLKQRVSLIWATNGFDAVKICSELPIDLVLMDVKLPKMDGFEATRQIKQVKSKLPVIALTAYAMPEDKTESMNAGCDNYISKPFKTDELFSLIDTYIN
jgi:signal transduction histidine kinase